jgi:hypothetical protein
MKNSGFYLVLIFWGNLLLGLSSCDASSAPLDADSRLRIDTTVVAINRKTQLEIDTACKRARNTELPRLIDSIKQVRKKEIESQLRSIPK